MTSENDTDDRPRIIALWGMPRSRSTAFFRMMAERGDHHVLHEPFSNLAEFGSVQVGDLTVGTEAELLAAIRELARAKPVFFKDTTDERYPALLADEAFLGRDATHTFIIRHPAETIASYHALNPEVRLHQIGGEAQFEIYRAVAARSARPPAVIDSADLVTDAPGLIAAYCAAVGIPFLPDALNWQPGERSEWQRTSRWHEEASSSAGFRTTRRDHAADLAADPALSSYLRHHLPFYETLRERRLQPAGRE
ncbi:MULTISPECIES: sulfotransferase-like domain-containing protein [Streptomyces]|uniref:sulfotransferase-like domain-containing protein n=1 Tax=Streptomyces TaxID=1883 RepID=UPI002108778C|nr:sulfotransferase family protein [Streptomyces longispororuber]MCQ4206655.1 sulfotransferase family protein [Streptomyces longispororuber]